MVDVVVTKEINVPAAKVWPLLADFGDMSWVPGMGAVEIEGQGVGMIRKISVGEGPPAIERLEALDNEAMSFRYSIVSGNPMPVENLQGGGVVEALDDSRCLITWSATAVEVGVSEDEAAEMLSGFYSGLLEVISSVASA